MAVDDLFSGAAGGETPSPIPRLRRWLFYTGVLVMAGPCCCTGPVGAFFAIWVWARAGDEMKRAELGIYPAAIGKEAAGVRNQAFGLMSVSSLSLCVQASLFGWYQTTATWLLQQAMELYVAYHVP